MSMQHNFFILLYISLLLESVVCFPCDAIDRKFNCDCTSENNNQTVSFDGDEYYNISSTNFVTALKTLHYCQGSFYCKPRFVPNPSPEVLSINNYMVCFSEDSCLLNVDFDMPIRDDICTLSSCMNPKKLIKFNVSNDVLDVDTYICIKVGPEGLKIPYCLKPVCKSFEVIEKLCVCFHKTSNCSCSSFCQSLLTNTSYNIYALFLSFEEVYVTKRVKNSTFHWVVVTTLSIGLIFLLVMFCKLCEISIDPSNCRNQTQSAEALRRMIVNSMESNAPSASTSAKTSLSLGDRGEQGSPPPTYEQVLKDKCKEFKRSVV